MLGIVTGVLAARLLLPEGRGQLAIILFWPVFLQGIGMLGLREAITLRVSNSKADIPKVVVSGLWLALVYAMVTYSISYFAMPILLDAEHQYLLATIRTYMFIFFPLSFIILCLRSVDQGRLNFTLHNFLVVSLPGIYLLALVILWYFGLFTVANVVWANLASIVVVSLVRMLLGWRWLVHLPSIAESKCLFTSGIKFHITSVAVLIGSQVDRLVLVTFWDNISIGMYAVALTVASAGIGALANSFQTIIFPRMSRLADKHAQRLYLAGQLRYAMVLLAGLALTIIGLSPWMIPMVFGEEYRSAIAPSMVLTLGLLPYGLRQILISAIKGLGVSTPGTISEIIALAIFILCVWPFGLVIGLSGVAAEMLVGNLCAIFYLFRYLRNRLQLNFRDSWGLNVATATQLFRVGKHYVFGR